MKKVFLALIASILVFALTLTPTANETAQAKTMWGKVELKTNMIGKVKIVKDTYQYSISKKKLIKGSKLKKGKEYGVYSYSKSYGGIYKIAKNKYVKKGSSIKYYKATQKLINDVKGYGTVKGDVTWQYNNYVGTKPDVGAKIFLIPQDFNPKNFKQSDLELYSMVGIAPKNSNLFYAKANGYGGYEINDVPAGKYIIVVSSKETTKNPDKEIYGEDDILKDRFGNAYDNFKQFNVGSFNNSTWSFIEVKKDRTIDYSHDFGNTYF